MRADALDGSPLVHGTYVGGLLAACGDDLLPFVQLYHCLLGAAPAPNRGARTHLVSSLAFGCPQLLPRLWRCEPQCGGHTRGLGIKSVPCSASFRTV